MESNLKIVAAKQPGKDYWIQMEKIMTEEGWMIDGNVTGDMHKSIDWCQGLVAIDADGTVSFMLIYCIFPSLLQRYSFPSLDKVQGAISWSAPPYSPMFYVGAYIVAKGLRGRGIGSQLWKRMIDSVPKDRVLALNAGNFKFTCQKTPLS